MNNNVGSFTYSWCKAKGTFSLFIAITATSKSKERYVSKLLNQISIDFIQYIVLSISQQLEPSVSSEDPISQQLSSRHDTEGSDSSDESYINSFASDVLTSDGESEDSMTMNVNVGFLGTYLVTLLTLSHATNLLTGISPEREGVYPETL